MELNVKIEYKVYYRVQIKFTQYFIFENYLHLSKMKVEQKTKGVKVLEFGVFYKPNSTQLFEKISKGQSFFRDREQKIIHFICVLVVNVFWILTTYYMKNSTWIEKSLLAHPYKLHIVGCKKLPYI